MNELTIIKRDGSAYVDSREVAKAIGKGHKNLLRDIRSYIMIMEIKGKPNFEPSLFFLESCYVSEQNKEMPCYLISKMGCELVANKLIGEKGVLFTVAYVYKFNEMETKECADEIKAHTKPRLSEFNSAVKNVLNGMSYCYATPYRVMSFLRGVYEPLGIKVRDEDDNFVYHSATFIASVLGMYSETGKPHGHAVSAIISKLDIPENHVIAVPFGLVGVMMRYDIEVVMSVINWLTNNNKPRDIPHLGFFYHVHYDPKKSHFFDNDDVIDLDDDPSEYTAEELDAMCRQFGDCDECPGLSSCCELN